MPRKNYIVEHLEPELEAWSALEYHAIATEIESTNSSSSTSTSNDDKHAFHITSVQPTLLANLPTSIQELQQKGLINVTGDDVEKLVSGSSKDRVCLLDPQAATELSPEDGKEGGFEWFVFGGILGDDPPRDRTAELRKYGFAGRRLGPVQMTTDTAVRVTRIVVEKGVPLDEIPYVDHPEIKLGPNESTQMPFRYVKTEDGKPFMADGMIELIKKDSDKGFGDML